jgi:peptide-methionine (R)-S-oxide reductase
MNDTPNKISKPDAEWRKQLSDLAYQVTRQKGTERAFSHDNFPKAPGTFTCVNCGAPLFDAATKYDSGSGWPSFWQPIAPGVVEEHADNSMFMRRVEVVCSRCDAHLGHVFDDGPNPTGQRYCMNGVALDFKPEGES